MKIVVTFGLCLALFAVFAGERGLPALFKARRDRTVLAQRLVALRAENTDLRAKADALRRDPATIEAVARETLGLARPDEIVVRRPRQTRVSD